MQNFEEVFFLERADHIQRIIFVCELSDFVSDGAFRDVFDVIIFLGGVEALLGVLFQRPVEAGGEAGGANHARRIFDEGVIVQNAQNFGFDIGHAVEGIKQESARAFV